MISTEAREMMRTEKEIQDELRRRQITKENILENENGYSKGYWSGYLDALSWVLHEAKDHV